MASKQNEKPEWIEVSPLKDERAKLDGYAAELDEMLDVMEAIVAAKKVSVSIMADVRNRCFVVRISDPSQPYEGRKILVVRHNSLSRCLALAVTVLQGRFADFPADAPQLQFDW